MYVLWRKLTEVSDKCNKSKKLFFPSLTCSAKVPLSCTCLPVLVCSWWDIWSHLVFGGISRTQPTHLFLCAPSCDMTRDDDDSRWCTKSLGPWQNVLLHNCGNCPARHLPLQPPCHLAHLFSFWHGTLRSESRPTFCGAPRFFRSKRFSIYQNTTMLDHQIKLTDKKHLTQRPNITVVSQQRWITAWHEKTWCGQHWV